MVIGPFSGLLLMMVLSAASSLAVVPASSSFLGTSANPTGEMPVLCSMILVMKLGAYAKLATDGRNSKERVAMGTRFTIVDGRENRN